MSTPRSAASRARKENNAIRARAHISYREVGWKYVLDAPYAHALPRRLCPDKAHVVYGSSGNRLRTLDRDKIMFHRGYCWDGASGHDA